MRIIIVHCKVKQHRQFSESVVACQLSADNQETLLSSSFFTVIITVITIITIVVIMNPAQLDNQVSATFQLNYRRCQNFFLPSHLFLPWSLMKFHRRHLFLRRPRRRHSKTSPPSLPKPLNIQILPLPLIFVYSHICVYLCICIFVFEWESISLRSLHGPIERPPPLAIILPWRSGGRWDRWEIMMMMLRTVMMMRRRMTKKVNNGIDDGGDDDDDEYCEHWLPQ